VTVSQYIRIVTLSNQISKKKVGKIMKNKKKKFVTLALTAGMLSAIAIGGTLAYFTDSDDAENVITMGNVDIALEGDGDIDLQHVVPNQKIDDLISVTNKGANNAFLRLKVDYSDSDLTLDDIESTFTSLADYTVIYATRSEYLKAKQELTEKGYTYEATPSETTYIKYDMKGSISPTNPGQDYYLLDETDNCWYKTKVLRTTASVQAAFPDGQKLEVQTIGTDRKVYTVFSLTEVIPVEDRVKIGSAEEYSFSVNTGNVATQRTGTLVKHAKISYTAPTSGISDVAWTKVAGEDGIVYYYYNDILNVGDEITFINSLHIPASWGNSYADKSLKLNITAEAVQSDYLEKDDGSYATTAQEAFDIIGGSIEKYEN
jgi:predicted ribosomally synthesized peptide with SipW-like signal peptide